MTDFDYLRRLIEGEVPASDASVPKPTEELPSLTSADTLPTKLELLTHRALEQSDAILSLPLDQGDAQFGAVLRAKTAIVGTTLTAKVRVDENVLRRPQRDDTMLKLLRVKMDYEEAKMKAAGTWRESNPEAKASMLAHLKIVGLIPLDYVEPGPMENADGGDDDGAAKKEPPGG